MTGTALLILAVLVAAAFLTFGRRDKARRIGLDDDRATARQRMEAADPRLSDADRAEVGRLLAANLKIEAIKLVRAKTGLGLKEAKEFVEHQDFGGGSVPASPAARGQSWAIEETPTRKSGPWAAEEASTPAPGPGLSPVDLGEVARELAAGRKIQAIKLVREKTGMGLKEAKDFVEGPAFDGRR